MESDSDGVRHAHQKRNQLTLEPVPHGGGLRQPRAREAWSHHCRGNAVSRARKRRLHGPLCKPTCHSIACTTPHQRQFVACSGDGQCTQKPSGLLQPTTANFQSNDHKLRPSTRAKEFWVGAFFPPPCCLESHAIRRLGLLSRCNAHTMVVSMATCPSSHGQTVDHHLQSASIQSIRRRDVHVSDHQICAHSSTSFSADVCHDAFECISPSSARKRRSTTTRNKWDGMVVSLLVGVTVKAAPARESDSSRNSHVRLRPVLLRSILLRPGLLRPGLGPILGGGGHWSVQFLGGEAILGQWLVQFSVEGDFGPMVGPILGWERGDFWANGWSNSWVERGGGGATWPNGWSTSRWGGRFWANGWSNSWVRRQFGLRGLSWNCGGFHAISPPGPPTPRPPSRANYLTALNHSKNQHTHLMSAFSSNLSLVNHGFCTNCGAGTTDVLWLLPAIKSSAQLGETGTGSCSCSPLLVRPLRLPW